MKKIITLLTIVIIAMAIPAQAFEIRALKFSDLFSNSDAIVSAKIIEVDNQVNAYIMTMQINEVLHGILSEETITVSSLKSDGFLIPTHSYLEKDSEYILFLKNSNSVWIFAGFSNAKFPISLKDDFKSIIQSYAGNRNIFTKNNSNSLIGLFNSTQSERLKNIILNDLEQTLNGSETGFLNSMMNSMNKRQKNFGISMLGKLKVADKRRDIENILTTDIDDEIRFNSIVSLGYMKNKNSAVHIKPFLASERQELRRSAIEALGKINDSANLVSLKSIYAGEPDLGNRLAIIDAIGNFIDKAGVISAYNEFKVSEPETFVKEYLDRKIDKLSK